MTSLNPREVSFAAKRQKKRDRERSGERKPLVAGDTNLTIRYDRCHENRLTSNQ